MRVLLSFQFKNQGKENVDLYYPGDIYGLKSDYAYVYYGDSTFEFVMYSDGFSDYDYQCFMSEVSTYPPGVWPKRVNRPTKYSDNRCQCGLEKAKAGGKHSSWCPKYRHSDDS